ncbi:putative Tigger transposable element-derived protein 1-like 218 [Homarus americanus]|uniref:Putative Tigger transposable element-derived protein 1-like 218 n=1 Tax=Homarus americanus TaxID=6706 RepID=A0A8J5NB04_HOMAM|nr:putative Tigger transposable element-derived protein 1-like 218 [Homarus americanus]
MTAGFHELESEDIEQVLASHTEELTNEDLQLLTEQSAAEDDDKEEEPQRTLTTKRIAEAFNMIQQGMQIFIDDDPNRGCILSHQLKLPATLVRDSSVQYMACNVKDQKSSINVKLFSDVEKI